MLKIVTVYGVPFEVEFDGTPFVPAQVSGPPENCYPAEGGEADIITVTLEGHDLTDVLSEDVMLKINEDLVEYLCSDISYDEECDRADYEFEQQRDEALCRC